MTQLYRILTNLTASDASRFAPARGAYVNIYFPASFMDSWESQIKEFIEYYEYYFLEFDGDPELVNLNNKFEDKELEAINDAISSENPRFGVFHTYLRDEQGN
jgi:hypothetical protein